MRAPIHVRRPDAVVDHRAPRPSAYPSFILRNVHRHRLRVGLALSLILVLAGIVIDSLYSASWALDDGLLVAAAAVIVLALLLLRGRGRA